MLPCPKYVRFGGKYVTTREYNNIPPGTVIMVTDDLTRGWVKVKWYSDQTIKDLSLNTYRKSAWIAIFSNPLIKPRSKEEYEKEKVRDYTFK